MKELQTAAEEIKQRTDGRVSFRFYPGGTMGTDLAVLRKIRIGQLHGGVVLAGRLADVDPDAGPGAADVRITYDPAQTDELAIKRAITEPYYNLWDDVRRSACFISPFRIEGYDPLSLDVGMEGGSPPLPP